MHEHGAREAAADREPHSRLLKAVERAAHLLPAQGPITVFIHHNTLHAFEDLPFEDAVVRAGRLFGCEPFLPKARYREELRAGRIVEADVEAVLREDLGSAGDASVGGVASRFELRRRVALHGIREARGPALAWLTRETDVLARFRDDLYAPADGRNIAASEGRAAGDLWEACRAAIRGASPAPPHERRAPLRHRDLLLAASGVDVDAWTHPLFIRFLAAFLDQGLAYWPMPGRERGLYRCFLSIHGQATLPSPAPWVRGLVALLREERATRRTAMASLLRSLAVLGVPEHEWDDFVVASALALRGWAGIVRQLEERPDRAPVRVAPASLVDFLAVRLLLDRAALAHAARTVPGHAGPLAGLRDALRRRLAESDPPAETERAWPLFHLAQLLGLDAPTVARLPRPAVDELEEELARFDDIERRRVLHLAYERRLRRRVYDALVSGGSGAPRREPVPFQAIFCLDEREESIRRHLEEVAPAAETFGAAGFFGVAMYYKGAEEAHPHPLCPVGLRPEHEVEEVVAEAPETEIRLRGGSRRVVGLLRRHLLVGSHTMFRGTIVMTFLGALFALPLVLRVLFPRLATRLERLGTRSMGPPSRRRLLLERRSVAAARGRHAGFTHDEMAAIVRRLLEDTGLAGRLAPVVLVVGHGSTSLNNPHESAHDCGACGGGRGGPNARAFAMMANDPEVRKRLAVEGVPVPPETWFIGSEHNTCNDAIEYFDVDAIPRGARAAFRAARRALEEAGRRNAHERCRRFYAAPTWYPPGLALAHVEGRAADLAQTRPEYGHATNALCVVGRRARTRGIFLDRRAFLVSYDPLQDDRDGSVLARLLAAVVPVVAGISLEYYFGRVDPVGYGCGTKLPHNVTALLGVMEGALSDLRTGLPWQMVEIHEPVRLTIVVEAQPERLARVVARDPTLARLVRNRWLFLASLAPESNTLTELRPDGFAPHVPGPPLAYGGQTSADWYGGRRGFLPFAAISGADGGPEAPA
jgi:uncharacterized protein YbcC (UPF0753/DUF2309 family)